MSSKNLDFLFKIPDVCFIAQLLQSYSMGEPESDRRPIHPASGILDSFKGRVYLDRGYSTSGWRGFDRERVFVLCPGDYEYLLHVEAKYRRLVRTAAVGRETENPGREAEKSLHEYEREKELIGAA